MDDLQFSFIIPVFNRPNEINELLASFLNIEFKNPFEIVIIEDGSDVDSKGIVEGFTDKLQISYYFKSNSGPGDSRNYGMERAKGNYFIILDSDCVLPPHYLKVVNDNLEKEFVDCYGGPDAAHESFTELQKAINFAMTSFMTTGGIRGGSDKTMNFQPRSFNMGLSKEAFQKSGGFGTIHPGEDPDLSIRLVALGYKVKLIKDAFVYHKRRISWSKYYKQVYKFGMVRPILNRWHPKTNKLIFWLPSIFLLGMIISIVMFIFGLRWMLYVYILYLSITFIAALITTKNVKVALQAMIAVCVQFTGYGFGFLKSNLILAFSNKPEELQFPKLFFKNVK